MGTIERGCVVRPVSYELPINSDALHSDACKAALGFRV